MAKTSKNSDAGRVPGWIWLVTGVLLGALIMFLMRLSELPPPHTGGKVDASSSGKQDSASEPSFEFYSLLRDTEVPVPERAPDQPGLQTPAQYNYLIQVASFQSLQDAEQVRAELTLLNLQAKVETANVSQGKTWHRVIVGPFESRSQLAKARDTLLSNRYEAMLLKR